MDKLNGCMYFLIEDNQSLETYNTIWYEILFGMKSALIK